MSTVYHASIPVDLAAPSRQRLGAAQFWYGDNNSHVFTALVADTGDPEAGLRDGTVSGTALRADGVTVVLEGEKGAATETVTFPNGQQAQGTPCSVTLPQAAFAVPGSLQISIKITDGTTATTVLSITGTVIRTETDSAVDPGEILPDLAELQAAAQEALDAADDATDAAADARSAAQSGVRYDAAQSLTDAQKQTARTNIGAAAQADVALITGNEMVSFTEKKGINTATEANLALQTDADTNCVKIACSAGDAFTISGEGWTSFALWAFYGDLDSGTGKYPRLSYSGTGATASLAAITAPTGAAYLVVNVKRSPANYAGFLCKGVLVQKRLSAVEEPVTYERTAFFERNHSDNLFNIDDYVVGRLNSDGTVDDTATSYFTTHYIDLTGITATYIVPVIGASTNIGASGIMFYDKNKAKISGTDSSFSVAKEIPDGTVYVRLSYNLASKYNFAVLANNTGTGSDQKIFYDDWQIGMNNVGLPGWYAGKKATALGDSITANGNMNNTGTHSAWRKFVANVMHFAGEIYNCGVGGSKVSGTGDDAMWKDARINAIPADTQVLFFNGGMNDWGTNVALGDEDSTDTSTFYGALNTLAEKLIDRVPDALIFWMTTTYGQFPDPVNSLGLSTYDYGRALKKVAEKHGFPVIDLHALCGWNQYNVATYVNEEEYGGETIYIHPNETGGKKITAAICSVLRNYQPYT